MRPNSWPGDRLPPISLNDVISLGAVAMYTNSKTGVTFAELPDPECSARSFYARVGSSEELPHPSACGPRKEFIIGPIEAERAIAESTQCDGDVIEASPFSDSLRA